jgi:hypothetical protein
MPFVRINCAQIYIGQNDTETWKIELSTSERKALWLEQRNEHERDTKVGPTKAPEA